MWIALSVMGTCGVAAIATRLIVVGHRKLDEVLASFSFGFAQD